MLDPPTFGDLNDLRNLFIVAVFFCIVLQLVSAIHGGCTVDSATVPHHFHLFAHVAIAASIANVVSMASTGPGVSNADPTFEWVQRSSVLLWLLLSRWLYSLVPPMVAGTVVLLPILSEGARVAVSVLYDEHLVPLKLTLELVIVVAQCGSFASLVGLRWLFVKDAERLFTSIPADDPNEDFGRTDGSAQKPRIGDTLPLPNQLSVEVAFEETRPLWVRGSVLRTLWRRWKYPFLLLSLCRLVFDLLGLLPAYLLRILVDNLSADDGSTDLRVTSVIIVLLVAMTLLSSLLRVQYDLKLQKMALYNRGLLSHVINVHAVSLRRHESTGTEGDIINHLLVDAQRVAEQMPNLNSVWALPMQVAITLYLLYMQVSFAFFAGVAITIAVIPINMFLAKKIQRVNTSMLQHNDERVLCINEVINNIVYAKTCGWSEKISSWIAAPRKEYMQCLRWLKLLDAVCVFFWATTPVFVSLATFALYVWIGGTLTAGKAIAALSLFNALILPLNAYPWVINGAVEAYVSLQRLDGYLKRFSPGDQAVVRAFFSVPMPLGTEPYPRRKGTADVSNPWSNESATAESASEDEEDQSINASNKKGSAAEKKSLLGRLTSKRRRAESSAQREEARTAAAPPAGLLSQTVHRVRDIADRNEPTDDDDEGSQLTVVPEVLVDIEHCRYTHTSPQVDRQLDSAAASPSFAVVEDLKPFVLYVPSFVALKGQLIAITGKAGSGKSTLLSAIAGEKHRSGGRSTIFRNSMAYVEQEPFLISGSIRTNILFGLEYSASKMAAVLKATALAEDLSRMELQDRTLVGDRGSALSGGQRYRVGIARAVYAEKDLYLFDDGLGSLDANVAAHIIEHVFLDLCRNKGRSVVIATHKTQVLEQTDRIYECNDEKVALLSPRERNTLLTSRRTLELVEHPSATDSEESAATEPAHLSVEAVSGLGVGRRTSAAIVPSHVSSSGDSAANEVTESGSLSLAALVRYLENVGVLMCIAVVLLVGLMQAARNFSDWYLALNVGEAGTDAGSFLGHLGFIALANAVLACARSFSFAFAGLRAARQLHDGLLNAVLAAPYSFFVSTPAGRIINRLSRDVYNVDDSLPFIMNILLAQLFLLLGSSVVIIANSSWVVCLGVPPAAVVYYAIQKPYRRVTREVKRLESASRSPLIDHLKGFLAGGVVLRALGPKCTFHFLGRARQDLSHFLRTNYNMMVLSAWFSLRMQLAGCAITALVGVVAVYYHNSAHAAPLGLALAYVSPLTSYISGLLSALTDTEKQLISVERIDEYLRIASERDTIGAPTALDGEPVVPNTSSVFSDDDGQAPLKMLAAGSVWPLYGTVQINDVSMRYDADGPLVLRNVSLHIAAGEKVAIVGRTGAGKTSLLLALLRLVPLQRGSIIIDGDDIKRFAPNDLRSRLGILPQQPFVFHGSLRRNLDPFSMALDDEVRLALNRVGLKHLSLDYTVEEEGKNLSCGERQLLMLARVLLQSSCLLLLDEPSAKIDDATDALLWELLGSVFKETTIIAITHNLRHIDFFDRVVVMEQGSVIDAGPPNEMWRKKVGPFAAGGASASATRKGVRE
jgi:ABC-type multidrug transport system fused ATPase/permease subunit